MAASKSLPVRPSLESLRKQAKKLARDRSLSLRDAQLALAREYGFAGWQDLTAEVSKRLGKGLEWAAAQAKRVIHDNDLEGLTQLLAEYPALLSWKGGDDGRGLLGMAAGSFGDSFNPVSEQHYTRAACAELLIDAGAIVMPSVCRGILDSRARGLLQLFQRKGVLPRTLEFFAALGDLDAVRAALDDAQNPNDPAAVNDAFVRACSFEHRAVAALLLDRSIDLDPELGTHIDGRLGRTDFVRYFIEKRPAHATAVGLWKAVVMEQVTRAIHEHKGHVADLRHIAAGDLPAFVRRLTRDPWLLGERFVWFQARLIDEATLNNRGEFITALLDLDPAILRQQPPPPSQAIEFAFTYANTHLVPLLTHIWPVPDDLPHAAGLGDLSRVARWFDASGAPALGDLDRHYPYNDPRARGHLHWNPPTLQQVLDVALAFSVINNHFAVADFLLAHGADINTNWSSHEPASILHELVFHRNYDAMRFLIDQGIDMTIEDYRWNGTAQGWARYAANDEELARWLEEAQRQRDRRAGADDTL